MLIYYYKILYTFDTYNIGYSLQYRKSSKYDTKSRGLGIVIMTRINANEPNYENSINAEAIIP